VPVPVVFPVTGKTEVPSVGSAPVAQIPPFHAEVCQAFGC